MTLVEKLVRRLRDEGWRIPDNYQFRRLRSGHWQRSAGVWSWTIEALGCDIGSPDNVRTCLRAKTLEATEHGTVYAD